MCELYAYEEKILFSGIDLMKGASFEILQEHQRVKGAGVRVRSINGVPLQNNRLNISGAGGMKQLKKNLWAQSSQQLKALSANETLKIKPNGHASIERKTSYGGRRRTSMGVENGLE